MPTTMTSEFTRYLRPTATIDSDDETVQAWARQATEHTEDLREKAVALFFAARDQIFYNPYKVQLEPETFKASYTLQRKRAFCIPKAILLAAGARVVGIPSRLGFADVKNHLASQRLLTLMKTDIFAYHGYTELYIEGQWRKATPTFNLALCQKIGVPPLDFDGIHDALFQASTPDGLQHMEYIHQHGTFDDFEISGMLESWGIIYPHFFTSSLHVHGDLGAEINEDQHSTP